MLYMKRFLLVTVVACGVGATTGCSNNDSTELEPATARPASMGMLNGSCPMTGAAVNPNADTATYEGHTIGFCCNGCRATWDGKSDAFKRGFVASLNK